MLSYDAHCQSFQHMRSLPFFILRARTRKTSALLLQQAGTSSGTERRRHLRAAATNVPSL
jgi:hypothetical protein